MFKQPLSQLIIYIIFKLGITTVVLLRKIIKIYDLRNFEIIFRNMGWVERNGRTMFLIKWKIKRKSVIIKKILNLNVK